MTHSESLQVSSSWSADVHVTWGLFSDNTIYEPSHFATSEDLLTVQTFNAQLLQFFINDFEILQASSLLSLDVHMTKITVL